MRLLIVDDVCLYREGLAEMLARRGLRIVGTASDPDSGARQVRNLHPDAVLLHVIGADAAAAIRTLKDTSPDVRVVVLGVDEGEDEVLACAEAGAVGYAPRDASVDDLVGILETVERGEAACPPRLAARLIERVSTVATQRTWAPEPPNLTSREKEIVGLIDQGLTNKEIARRLSIRLPTVKNHVHNILEKLHLAGRHEAAALVLGNHGSRPQVHGRD